jgi:hypothetical protein
MELLSAGKAGVSGGRKVGCWPIEIEEGMGESRPSGLGMAVTV